MTIQENSAERPISENAMNHLEETSTTYRWSSLRDFKCMRMIGFGRSSVVYSAKCVESNLPLVLKVYEKSKLNDLGRVLVDREIEYMQLVSHKNIIKYYSTFEEEDKICIVLEYASKGDVYQRYMCENRDNITESLVVQKILHPLLCALNYLHSIDIIHRDIKPENLLIDSKGNLKLADFGFAISTTKFRPRARLGTLDYMSPEVIKSPPMKEDDKVDVPMVSDHEECYDGKVDVWACGILAYELLVGKAPFARSTRNDTFTTILTGEVHFPNDSSVALSPECRSFITEALNKLPATRPTIKTLLSHPWIQQHMFNSNSCPTSTPLSQSFPSSYFNETNFQTRVKQNAIRLPDYYPQVIQYKDYLNLFLMSFLNGCNSISNGVSDGWKLLLESICMADIVFPDSPTSSPSCTLFSPLECLLQAYQLFFNQIANNMRFHLQS